MFGSDFVSLLEHAASLLSDEYNIHFLPDLPENTTDSFIQGYSRGETDSKTFPKTPGGVSTNS